MLGADQRHYRAVAYPSPLGIKLFTPDAMKNHLLRLLLGTLCLALLMSDSAQAQATWKFSIVVAVDKQTADYYQKAYGKDITTIVKAQMATINANFNKPNTFKGIYNFQIDSIYVFDGPARDEVFRPHPKHAYAVVINGFSDNSVGGGWWGSYQTIYHSWKWDSFDGPFGPYATDGLTHEFAHARGAVDIYAMRVEGAKNPVNNTTFEPVSSIMNYPYGNITWDEYTTNLLNSTADGPIVGEQWITKPFPNPIGIQAVDAQGKALEGVVVDIYPVEWFSLSVLPNSILRAATNNQGIYTFPANPYRPSTSGYPWNMRYCNFLIKATYNGTVVYKWMPLYEVQNAYFKNGENTVYNTVIEFPATTPNINLTRLNGTSFAVGSLIEASFTTSGMFDATNIFTLQVVDEFNNAFVIGSTQGNGGTTISGRTPGLNPAGKYKVRIGSSKPNGRSNDVPIILTPFPDNQLRVAVSRLNCTTGAILLYAGGGDGSPITFTAPGITRISPSSTTGIVEQGLLNDPKPISVSATQSGQTWTYVFDLATYCNNSTGSLIVSLPDYNCASGFFSFRTTGGDGSPIEFMAVGITGWTTNPNQFVDVALRTANDSQPFTLMARQSGKISNITWDLKAACGRAREAVSEAERPAGLSIQVLGNPVSDQLRVLVQEANGQPVQLRLLDVQGRVLESRTVQPAEQADEQQFSVGKFGPGLLLLQATSPRQTRMVKVVRQ